MSSWDDVLDAGLGPAMDDVASGIRARRRRVVLVLWTAAAIAGLLSALRGWRR